MYVWLNTFISYSHLCIDIFHNQFPNNMPIKIIYSNICFSWKCAASKNSSYPPRRTYHFQFEWSFDTIWLPMNAPWRILTMHFDVCIFKLMNSTEINGQSTIRNWVNDYEFKWDFVQMVIKKANKNPLLVYLACYLQPSALLIFNSSIVVSSIHFDLFIFVFFSNHIIFAIVQ